MSQKQKMNKNAAKAAKVPGQTKTRRLLRKKRFWLANVIVVLAVFVGVVAYAAYQVRQPEGVLKRALAKTLEADTSIIDLSITNGAAEAELTVFELRGPVTAQGRFDLVGSYRRPAADSRGVGISLRGADGNDLYLRLAHISQLNQVLGPEAARYGLNPAGTTFAGLEDRWLTVPASLKDTVLQNRPSDGKTNYALSESEQLALVRLYRRHEFLKISAVLPADDAAGPAERFRLQIDRTQFASFIQATRRQLARFDLSDKQINSLIATAGRISDMEVVIGKADTRIHSLHFNLVQGSSRQTVSLGLSGFNQSADIVAPVGAVPLFQALTDMAAR